MKYRLENVKEQMTLSFNLHTSVLQLFLTHIKYTIHISYFCYFDFLS